MDLNELSVGVEATLLIQGRLRRSGADHGVSGLAEDRANAAGGDNDRVSREGADFHGAQVHGADPATDFLSVEHGREELPVLVFLYFSFRLVAPDLLIERIEKLLPGRCTGERGAVVQGSAEA